MLRVSRGRGYFSKHLIDRGVRQYYTENNLWPNGVSETMPAIKEWSARMGLAISRLVPWTNYKQWVVVARLKCPTKLPLL